MSELLTKLEHTLKSVALALEVGSLGDAERKAWRLCCQALASLGSQQSQLEVARLLSETARLDDAQANTVLAAGRDQRPEQLIEAAVWTLRDVIDER